MPFMAYSIYAWEVGRNDMARNFRELQEKISPESRARSEARAQDMLKKLPLSELREAQNLTQAELAKR